MENEQLCAHVPRGGKMRRAWLVMRLAICFVCVAVIGTSANVLSQYRVSVNLGETTYKDLFEEIRKQTGCIVMYSDEMLDKDAKVDAVFEDASLEEVLREVLAGKGLTYEKTGNLSSLSAIRGKLCRHRRK